MAADALKTASIISTDAIALKPINLEKIK